MRRQLIRFQSTHALEQITISHCLSGSRGSQGENIQHFLNNNFIFHERTDLYSRPQVNHNWKLDWRLKLLAECLWFLTVSHSAQLSPLSLSGSHLGVLDAPPVPEGDVVFGAGEEEHEGEGGDGAEAVDDDEGEEEGGLDVEQVRAGGAGVDELALLPQLGPAETEAGLGRPAGRGLEGGRAGGRAQGDQVEAVGDGGHQAEH